MNRLRATSTSLVTLVAPAGYGKTTLAAQWVERERRPCAWLSVDESDDDPAVLLARLGEALESIPADDRSGVASARLPKQSTELQRLASRLSTLEDFVVVLDDAQLIRSRNATKALTTLAKHVPAGSTLALVGRLAPALPIARLRADGRLLELGAADLALSGRESEALLRGLDAGLTGDEATELIRRCEGWAAGIRLSVLAAQEHAGARDEVLPRGDDRFLAEYFSSEFLSPLTDELRTFLRRTSVLDRLTAPVCDAVLKRGDSGRILASLERRHLLLAPLDRRGEAYRCHPLLRDLLTRELGETEPALVVTLHRRAADWFEAHGDPEPALGHAEGAGDIDRMARIVAAIALPTYYRGRITEVEAWLERFDDEAQLEQYPAVAVLGGWIHALGGRPAAAERWLAAAERGAALERAPDDDSVAPAISVLRAALCRDGVEQMCADVESALGGLPADSQWRPTALLLLGCTLVLRGQDALADAILAAAEESAERLDATDTLIVAISERSLLASARGEPALAEAHSLRARALAEEYRLDGYTTTALELAVCRAHGAAQQPLGRCPHQPGVRTRRHPAPDRSAAMAGGADAARAHPRVRDAAGRRSRAHGAVRGARDPTSPPGARRPARSGVGAAARGRGDVGRRRAQRRRPHPGRAPAAAAARHAPLVPRDRRTPLRLPQHGQDPGDLGLSQARRLQPQRRNRPCRPSGPGRGSVADGERGLMRLSWSHPRRVRTAHPCGRECEHAW